MKTYIAVLAGTPSEFIDWIACERPGFSLNLMQLVADPPPRARTQEDCDAEPSYAYISPAYTCLQGLRIKDYIVLPGYYVKYRPGREREEIERAVKLARRSYAADHDDVVIRQHDAVPPEPTWHVTKPMWHVVVKHSYNQAGVYEAHTHEEAIAMAHDFKKSVPAAYVYYGLMMEFETKPSPTTSREITGVVIEQPKDHDSYWSNKNEKSEPPAR